MTQHNAEYFLAALKKLDWSRGYTGNELINLFNDFPIGWFAHVPDDQQFTRWEDFWCFVTPVSASTVGPQLHQEVAGEFIREADQRDSTGWGR